MLPLPRDGLFPAGLAQPRIQRGLRERSSTASGEAQTKCTVKPACIISIPCAAHPTAPCSPSGQAAGHLCTGDLLEIRTREESAESSYLASRGGELRPRLLVPPPASAYPPAPLLPRHGGLARGLLCFYTCSIKPHAQTYD